MKKENRKMLIIGLSVLVAVLILIGGISVFNYLQKEKFEVANNRYEWKDYVYSLDEDNNAIITEYNGKESKVVIPDSIEGHKVVRVGNGGSLFEHKENVCEVTLPDTVISLGSYAFASCVNLNSIQLPEGMVSIEEGVFCLCDKLNNINIPDTVKEIGEEAFAECNSLTEIIIPDSVDKIGNSAFDNCVSLQKVELPQKVAIHSYAFRNCDKLENITMYNGTIGEHAFAHCDGLRSVELSNGVTTIMAHAFTSCDNLETVKLIPGDFDVQSGEEGSIGRAAFWDCKKLKSVELSDTVTEINFYAFSGCESLSEIVIPDSVKTVGENAFEGCTSLRNLKLPEGAVVLKE